MKNIDILDHKPIQTFIVSNIDFWKNMNKLVDKKFVYLYQSYINTYIQIYIYIRLDLDITIFIFRRYFINHTSKYIVAI